MGEEKAARAPKMRLSAEQRDRFLEVLGQTGNRRLDSMVASNVREGARLAFFSL